MASKIWPLNTKMQSRTCLCSPTKHPGSFKCSCHRHSNEPVSSGCRTVPVCAAFLNYRGLGSIKKTNFNTVNLLQMGVNGFQNGSFDVTGPWSRDTDASLCGDRHSLFAAAMGGLDYLAELHEPFELEILSGVLAGSLVSGVQIAISASNTGGAWDNAKYIEAGASEHARTLGPKRSSPHKAAIGDPLKDTSGPSLNILITLMAVESLVFSPFFATPWFTNPSLYQFFSRDAISRFKPGIEKIFP
ncbi:uncharacterized protein LOC105793750 [Gossypium raimondii]|uniref:uncharacterized protein LOC105793750 n=1 Tax=Gossypium raimondii TaxID=29730 RepID=UPI00227A0BD1|nr:uncharacterized protein LOC105793750 [Gossypium raimondii]